MAKNINDRITQQKLSKRTYQIFDLVREERNFLFLITFLIMLSAIVSPYPQIAMWVGFAIAGYSAIANDSIQTIGTFIASNSHRRWWSLWLFMGLIFVATATYSWIVFDGDVSHQRLASKGLSDAPTSFQFLQLASPVILLILTRLRMPVSTTFLLLSAFSSTSGAILGIVSKSLFGYVVAFVVAIVVWTLVSKYFKRSKGKPAGWWVPVQWISSGALWSVWLSQDAANIAVFLPRSLDVWQFLGFTLYIFLGMGLLFYLKGDKIQSIVNEKSGVTDTRAATVVDFIYAIILYYFKVISTVPVSTTWIFIGLLGGRELAISLSKRRKKKRERNIRKSLRMLGRDLLFATIGLLISMILALAINDDVRREIFELLF
jgi:hypothetical protein